MERADRYHRTAAEIHEVLDKLGLTSTKSWVLDFGCSVGFLMEGFEKLGYTNVFGYDASEWAGNLAMGKGLKMVRRVDDLYQIIIALDVFEHMEDLEITDTFYGMTNQVLIARIPCARKGKTFYLESARKDDTHINCKNKSGWKKIFYRLGYKTVLHLNLYSIYDSDGVFSVMALRGDKIGY